MCDYLQSCPGVPGIVYSSCETSSDHRNEDMTVKVEPPDTEVGEHPVPISFPKIKIENEVSYMCLCSSLHISHLLLLFLHFCIHDKGRLNSMVFERFPTCLRRPVFCTSILLYDYFHIVFCQFKIT